MGTLFLPHKYENILNFEMKRISILLKTEKICYALLKLFGIEYDDDHGKNDQVESEDSK